MPDNSASNKRIAKNTLLLYARMLLLLVVSLYTSRIVLATLGIEDYGIYNVVGGIVTMFTFLNAAMGNSSHRFITYAIGKGDEENLRAIVGTTCSIHWLIAGIILLLAETVGLWFLHYKMIIPEGRMVAAEWVYQFSVLACVITIISVPFNAMIIAHEKMGAFASISILDAVLKLLIVYLIQITSFDKLIFYAALILCVNILDRVIYQVYCTRHFKEARNIKLSTKYPQFKEMTAYAGWSIIGNLAYVGFTQGLNILLNVFFGPAINAARGIAVQVQGAVKGFVTNFQTAVNPQIIKSYAQGEFDRLHTLIYSSSKFSFFLLYCMVLPIAIEADTLLGLWLKEVPEGTVIFTVLTLLILLVDTLSNPIDKANQATGKIRTYQIVEGGSLLLILPIAYIVLKLGGKPYSVFVVQMIVMYCVQIARLFIVCHKIRMSKREYAKKVLVPVAIVAIVSAIPPLAVYYVLPKTITSFILTVAVAALSVLIFAFFIGLNKREKQMATEKIHDILNKFTGRKDK